MFILNLIIFLLILGIVVLIHEFGHYFFAKRAGILVHEFAIGMGPVVYQKRKGETVYSLRAIPIGGYVAMSGESVDEALIKKGQQIGVNLNSNGEITEIILDESIEPQIKGSVLDFDLYGKDLAPLFITIQEDEKLANYPVVRNAKYLYKKKEERFITPSESSFENKTWLQRFLTIVAGPVMNFILALVIFVIIAAIAGKPQNSNVVNNSSLFERNDQIVAINQTSINNWNDISSFFSTNTNEVVTIEFIRDGETMSKEIDVTIIIQSLGITNQADNLVPIENRVVIGTTAGRASEAGLKTNDLVVQFKIDNHAAINNPSWSELIEYLNNNKGTNATIEVSRDGSLLDPITYELLSDSTLEQLGSRAVITTIDIAPIRVFSFTYILTYPFTQFWANIKNMGATIGLLFNPNSGVGVGDLAGPIGIFSLVSNAASQGVLSLLSFMAFLSINIAFINLLPLPALDGGRIVFLAYEGITRKKINRRVENMVNNIGFMLLLLLMVYVAFNDVLRLF